MVIYGILVHYPNGEENINEGYKTFAEAVVKIRNKCGKGYWKCETNEYKHYDIDKNITYEIKQIEI